ncbi:MAG: hypothetical protein BMS9Abin02_1883 [Anaerolineae bacterium]|nr:MAG: hypothetical protein BMS9Abin02_1883 [Anaerolineae bacterium]
MNSLDASFIVILLFLLRLAVPLILTLLFGLMMNRLLDRMNYKAD